MCILFLHAAKHSPQNLSRNLKRFVLVANRDENYLRPSKSAHFWESDENILAGKDEESGGTWLGVNKRKGRLAAVTNIMGGTTRDPADPKLSRGSVISTFLRSESRLNGTEYCSNLYQDEAIVEKYNKFNLITVDCFETSTSVTYLTNASHSSPPLSFDANENDLYFGLSNSIWQCPFKKVTEGTEVFKSILEKYNKRDNESHLLEELLKLLKNQQPYWPDAQLEKLYNKPDRSALKNLSSIFVDIPPAKYGTRTHTVILIDWDNNVDFYEWTLDYSCSSDSQHPTWHHSQFKFPMQSATVPMI